METGTFVTSGPDGTRRASIEAAPHLRGRAGICGAPRLAWPRPVAPPSLPHRVTHPLRKRLATSRSRGAAQRRTEVRWHARLRSRARSVRPATTALHRGGPTRRTWLAEGTALNRLIDRVGGGSRIFQNQLVEVVPASWRTRPGASWPGGAGASSWRWCRGQLAERAPERAGERLVRDGPCVVPPGARGPRGALDVSFITSTRPSRATAVPADISQTSAPRSGERELGQALRAGGARGEKTSSASSRWRSDLSSSARLTFAWRLRRSLAPVDVHLQKYALY
jgi:hypothetical protein